MIYTDGAKSSVACDVDDCGAQFFARAERPTVSLTRAQARRRGWACSKKRDICALHARAARGRSIP